MKTIAAVSIALLALSGRVALAADAKAGQAAYDKSCKGCHGAAGAAGAGILKMFPAIPDLSSSKVQEESDAAITQTITAGKGKMPAAKNLSAPVEDVVAFVRTLKK